MSVANFKNEYMITAEEFFRNKIKEKNPNKEVVTLSRELITAEEGMRWAHEFKEMHLQAVSGQSQQLPKSCECDNVETFKGWGNEKCYRCKDCGRVW
jgi:hypothetical protein